MKIVIIIDSLGSGGAERQSVELAVSLKQLKHNVLILCYAEGDHFLNEINNQGVEFYQILEKNPIFRILKFRRKIKEIQPNAIIAFLQTSSILAELSSIPFKNWKLIVSERNNLPYTLSFRSIIINQLYRIADFVTTNAESTTESLARQAPYLSKKIKTIYNGLDLLRFKPVDNYMLSKRKVLVALASHQNHKNAVNLILAFKKLKGSKPDALPILYWYGSDMSNSSGRPSNAYLEAKHLIHALNLENDFILQKPVKNVESIYQDADALILGSYWEGLPNVVCEAMGCGLPILMSKVSDYNILTEGNGLSFLPDSVDSIADAIAWFCNLNQEEILKMRNISRSKAEKLFPKEKMINSYLELIGS